MTDRGSEWHPKYMDGDLPDLDDDAMTAHLAKPEYVNEREAGPLAAEDSTATAKDVV